MAECILTFQAGRLAKMAGKPRDARRHKDWLEGWDQVRKAKEAMANTAKE